jgi:vacuolar-type H+-ATPase subunit E/Vma4
MNDSLNQQTAERMGDAESQFNVESRSNEIIRTLGEAKSAISGKGLLDKTIGNIKKAAVKKAKAALQDVKDKANQAIKDGLEKGKSTIKDTLEKGKSTVEDTLEKGKSTVKDLGKRGNVEESGLQSERGVAPKIDDALENVSAEESDLTRTSQAASRGEQIFAEMKEARESGDVGISGGEDAQRIGQAAGKVADGVPGPPPGVGGSTEAEMRAGSLETQAKEAAAKGAESAGEKEVAVVAEKKAATVATEKVVGKAAVKGAEEGGEIIAEGGGPEDVVGDVIGAAVGIGTTLYSIFKKPHEALSNAPVSEASQSFQVGF